MICIFKLSILSIILASLASCAIVDPEWNNFKIKFNKNYQNPLDESSRHEIFLKNKEFVESFNNRKSSTHSLGINQFFDLTSDEIKSIFGKGSKNQYSSLYLNRSSSVEAQAFLDKILNDKSIEVPDSVDWRTTGNRVTPIRSQGQCGQGLYAFATVALLEGQMEPRNFSLIDLSPQNIVDCPLQDGYNGCHKHGTIEEALEIIVQQGGIASEKKYPFDIKGHDTPCRFDPDMIGFSGIKGYSIVSKGDEEVLKKVVATYGPVATTMDSDTKQLAFYEKGIYRIENKEKDLTNGQTPFVIVGYGKGDQEIDGDYWIGKLPNGVAWGEDGYIKIKRNCHNCLGVATAPIIATF